jgi:hypothetical protein
VAITATPLASNVQDADSSAYGTPSISPTAGSLVLAWIASVGGDGVGGFTPSTPSLTGAGMTWTYVDDIVNVGMKISLFRALSASPGSGALTATFNSGLETQSDFAVQIAQFAGVDKSGTNGSGAIVQSATAGSNRTFANNTSITFTFASAISNPNNAVAGAIYLATGQQVNPGSGFTELGDASSTRGMESEFKAAGQQTVPWSWGSLSAGVNLPVELKAGATESVGMIPIFG